MHILCLLNIFSWFLDFSKSDWISLFSAIATFLAVIVAYITNGKSLKSEKESNFRSSRPYFILRYLTNDFSYELYSNNCLVYGDEETINSFYKKFEEYKNNLTKDIIDNNLSLDVSQYSTESEKYTASLYAEVYRDSYFKKQIELQKNYKFLEVKNVSQKSIIALQVTIGDYQYRIDLLNKLTSLFLFLPSNFNPDEKIVLCFTNELREKEKLVFQGNKDWNINYLEDLKVLENKGGKIFKEEYDVSGFTQTYRKNFDK